MYAFFENNASGAILSNGSWQLFVLHRILITVYCTCLRCATMCDCVMISTQNKKRIGWLTDILLADDSQIDGSTAALQLY